MKKTIAILTLLSIAFTANAGAINCKFNGEAVGFRILKGNGDALTEDTVESLEIINNNKKISLGGSIDRRTNGKMNYVLLIYENGRIISSSAAVNSTNEAISLIGMSSEQLSFNVVCEFK